MIEARARVKMAHSPFNIRMRGESGKRSPTGETDSPLEEGGFEPSVSPRAGADLPSDGAQLGAVK